MKLILEMNCKKCNVPSSIILREKDHYCNVCFLTKTNHKFRACIGKNKILSSNEKVLICLSGGLGSTVLLDLVQSGISLDSHKKLRIVPYILHLIGIADNDVIADSVMKQCEKYNLNIYMIHISDYIHTNSQLPDVNCIPKVNSEADKSFQEMLKSMPPTACNDFLNKIKRSLFVRFASLLKCNFIFTAETTTGLAINLLSNLALGRGSQVQNDIGFLDTRHENIKILRPMKDISKKELYYYITIKQLYYIEHNDVQTNSLQSVISDFVTDLQENFQSTISTVCKTADKIGGTDDGDKFEKCIICENTINKKTHKFSALEATNFSRTVSNGKSQLEKSNESSLADSVSPEDATSKTMFPFINKCFCYGCSRNYSEMSQDLLPERVQKLLHN